MGNNLIFMRRRLGIMAQPHRETKTGDLVTFTGIKAPLSVLAQIVPVQSGSGDPSPENVRPITGWTGCDISNTNAILYDCTENPPAQGTLNSSTGVASTSNYRIRTPFIEVASSTKYRILTNLPYVYVHEYSANDGSGYIGNSGEWKEPPFAFTTTGTTKYVRFVLALNTGSTTRVYPADLEYLNVLEYDATQILSVNWTDIAGTVYGGSLKVNTDGTGVLTGTDEYYEFDGSEDEVWRKASSGIYFFIKVSETKVYENDAIISNMYPQGKAASNTDVINITYASSGTSKDSIYIHPSWVDEDTTIADIKAYLAEHTLQAVVKLITPVTYNLTSQQVGQLLANNGVNNVWSNANGQITVNYWKH